MGTDITERDALDTDVTKRDALLRDQFLDQKDIRSWRF